MDKTTIDNTRDPAVPPGNSGQPVSEQVTITNEATLWRRDWIDRAVSSVRSKLAPTPFDSPQPAKRGKPKLYVAWSRPQDSAK